MSTSTGSEDGQLSGGRFDLLDFEALVYGVRAVQSVFTTTESALVYFDDQVLDLGSLSPGSDGLIDLTFDLSLAGRVAGDGFANDLAVADVPEPRSSVLLATGLALVFGLARRRAALGSLRLAAPKPIRPPRRGPKHEVVFKVPHVLEWSNSGAPDRLKPGTRISRDNN